MKIRWITSFVLILGLTGPAWAQNLKAGGTAGNNTVLSDSPDSPSNDQPDPELSSEDSDLFFLRDQDLILSASRELETPQPPQFDSDGKPLRTAGGSAVPDRDVLGNLAPVALDQGDETSGQEKDQPKQYQWRTTSTGWSYCHYLDYEGNHWFGWRTGEKFQWVLRWSGHFWWKDGIGARWLGFDKGEWWWPDPRNPRRAWVYREGTYYLCDAKGAVVDGRGEHPGEFRSAWKQRFQGDLASAAPAFDPGGGQSPGPAPLQVSLSSGQH